MVIFVTIATSRFSGEVVVRDASASLFGSCSQAIPDATSRKISNRRSTGIGQPSVFAKRTRALLGAMNTCEDVAAHRWKKGTRGD